MNIQEARSLIIQLCKHPGAILIFEDNKLSVNSAQSLRTKTDHTKLTDIIYKNHDIFQNAVSELYYEGLDSRPFQKEINNIFERAATTYNTPNFYKHTTSKWMENLSEEEKKKKMSEFILPGTHDSGANKIMWDKTPAIVNSFWKKIVYKILKIPIIRNIAERWTVTQKFDISEQLQNGIRLLDFRLAKDVNGDLHLSHSFIVADFKESIQKIKEFIDENPKEFITVLIKTDPLYHSVMTEQDIQKAHDIIKKELQKEAITSSENIQNHTLKSLQENGKNIIFHSNFGDKAPLKSTLFHEKLNYSGWSNAQRTKHILPGITKMLANKDTADKFVHVSLNTTPNTRVILKKTLSPIRANLIKRGIKSQEYLHDLLIQSKVLKIHGVKFDNPQHNVIQVVINQNKLTKNINKPTL
jgi:hypothetical protein